MKSEYHLYERCEVKLYANSHTLAFSFSIPEGHPGSVGKSTKGKAGVGRGKDQLFTRGVTWVFIFGSSHSAPNFHNGI